MTGEVLLDLIDMLLVNKKTKSLRVLRDTFEDNLSDYTRNQDNQSLRRLHDSLNELDYAMTELRAVTPSIRHLFNYLEYIVETLITKEENDE